VAQNQRCDCVDVVRRREPRVTIHVHLAASLIPDECTLSLLDAGSNGRHFRHVVRPTDVFWKAAGTDLIGTCTVDVPPSGPLVCRAAYAGSLHDELQFGKHAEHSTASAITTTDTDVPPQINPPRSVHVKIDQDYVRKLLEACQASEKPTFDISTISSHPVWTAATSDSYST
jgi:hypothetical protein